MKNQILFSLLLLFVVQLSCTSNSQINEPGQNPSHTLWYDEPAATWTDALPIGNGRLGAMIYGGTETEVIQFNEETLWAGQPHDYANEGAYKYLEELRDLLRKGKQKKAHDLGNKHFMSDPFGQLCYLPFANVELHFPGHENAKNFSRQLNLENALASVQYDVDGVSFKREYLSSAPDETVAMRLEAGKKGALSFSAAITCPHENYEVSVEGDEVVVRGVANNYPEKNIRQGTYPESKVEFEARLKINTEGGEFTTVGNAIEIKGANSASLYLVAATSFVNYKDISADPGERCADALNKIADKNYTEIKNAHIEDYSSLYGRVSLDLGKSEISGRPTDERLISFKEDEDPNLVALLFQYGRYLLISSSRPGTQPANLQGIWNDRLAPPWDSKYTININTEMNYWLSEITNLSELSEPLFKMVEELSETGQNVAKEHYNLEGWVTHHNTDIWRGAAPINHANHGIWVTGGAWLSQHLWWHYQFNEDKEFLQDRAYPVLKEASRFFMNYLVPDQDNPEWLVSGPSNSPELGGLVMAPTMDHQIIRNLLGNTIEAAAILDVDSEFAARLKEVKAKIAPNKIGQYGQLQEWLVDQDNPRNQHRHVSHLWGLHPGNEIHPLTTPELAEACRTTLKHRGDGGTGWSRAWKINFWARLLDGDHSFLLLKNLMVPSRIQGVEMKDKGGLYMNLFDAHPPFQIDGNFGATSGIAEMLLQSHLRDENGDFFQDILPALPRDLANGTIAGIKGRGGFEFEINWEKGTLKNVIVKSLLGNKLQLRYQGKILSQDTQEGESYIFTSDQF